MPRVCICSKADIMHRRAQCIEWELRQKGTWLEGFGGMAVIVTKFVTFDIASVKL
jgi:hypothetical protein